MSQSSRPVYKAIARFIPEIDGWAVTVPAVPDARAHVAKLSNASDAIREALELLLDTDRFAVVVEIDERNAQAGVAG